MQSQQATAQRMKEKQFSDARLVTARFRKAGTVSVFLKNNGPHAIGEVRLEKVEDARHPIYDWRVMRAANATPSSWDALASGQEVQVAIELLHAPNAVASDSDPDAFRATHSFTDTECTRWRRN